MMPIKTIARYSLWSAVLLTALSVVLHFLLPYAVNTQPVKDRLIVRVQRAMDGDADFGEIRLGLYPLPHAKVVQGRLSIPGKMALSIDSVSLYAKIRPLLVGRLEMDAVSVRGPRMTVTLPEAGAPPAPGTATDFAGALSGIPVDSRLMIVNGHLDLLKGDASVIQIVDVTGSIQNGDDGLRIDLEGAAEAIDQFRLQATIPRSPEAVLAGSIKGKGANVDRLRRTILALIDTDETPAVLEVIRHGTVTAFDLSATGQSLADLVRLEAIRLEATLADGRVRVPGVALDLTAVAGEIIMADGVLEVREASARMENTAGRQGALTMGLLNDPLSMNLGIDLEADLAQLPPVLKRVVDHPKVLDELERLKTLRGRALGRLRLEGPVNDLVVEADAHHVEMEVEHDRLPYPLAVTDGRVAYEENGLRLESIRGRIGGSNLESLTADLRWDDDPLIAIETGRLVDDHSDVTFSVAYNAPEGAWDLSIQGHLAQPTLPGLRPGSPSGAGWIRGEAAVSFLPDTPWESTLEGAVELADWAIALGENTPVHIHYLDLNAGGDRLDVGTLDLSLAGERVVLAGTASRDRDAVVLDLRLSAQTLNLGPVQDLIDRARPKEAGTAEGTPTLPPMRGSIASTVDRLTYGQYQWEPMRATLVFDDRSALLRVDEASLCGISTVGSLEWTPGQVRMDLTPSADNQALQYAGGCLTASPSTERLSGTFTVSGNLTATGANAEALSRNLQGIVQVAVTDGRVHNIGDAGLFTNILSFIKLNNLVRGDLPDMRERDFRYKRMQLQLRFEGSRAVLQEATLTADAFNMVGEGTVDLTTSRMDLTVLVSPLTTLDALIRHVPIVGRILEGTLVAIPMGIKGPPADPRVVPLSPKAVGSRLLGILQRTLETPFRLIEPILPGAPEGNNATPRPTNGE